MEEICEVIADFPITTNQYLEIFQNRQVLW